MRICDIFDPYGKKDIDDYNRCPKCGRQMTILFNIRECPECDRTEEQKQKDRESASSEYKWSYKDRY